MRHLLGLARKQGVDLELMETSFFLSRDSLHILPLTRSGHMGRLRSRYFKWLYKNSTPATDFYRIPGNRVVEMGSQLDI